MGTLGLATLLRRWAPTYSSPPSTPSAFITRVARTHVVVPGVGLPDQGALAKGGKGLRLGVPKGARAAVAMEGRRGRGSGGFP